MQEKYETTNGILYIEIINETEDYVFVEFKFNEQKSQIKQITKDNFYSLNKWVEENFCVI